MVYVLTGAMSRGQYVQVCPPRTIQRGRGWDAMGEEGELGMGGWEEGLGAVCLVAGGAGMDRNSSPVLIILYFLFVRILIIKAC